MKRSMAKSGALALVIVTLLVAFVNCKGEKRTGTEESLSQKDTLERNCDNPADRDSSNLKVSEEADPADRVHDIYARIIANGRDSVESGALSYDSRLFDTRDYLSADYYRWYKKVEDYDNAKDNEGWRFFNYDHWGTQTEYNCITKAGVAQTESLPDGRVQVRVELECASYNIGEKTPSYTAPEVVTLILVRDQPDGWYVDDFLDKDGGSEKERMKEYLKKE